MAKKINDFIWVFAPTVRRLLDYYIWAAYQLAITVSNFTRFPLTNTFIVVLVIPDS